jgi:phosphoribosylformylglycinamidine synthase II
LAISGPIRFVTRTTNKDIVAEGVLRVSGTSSKSSGVSDKSWEDLGLSQVEYDLVQEVLGREPNWTELSMFAVMWSEHCSYKHSKPYLRLFPTSGPRVLIGPGENAGVIRLDERHAVVMKCESHNHPSAIEPYQGAATGVGGIVRDILAMGSRPAALLTSLRLGPLEDPHTKHLLEGMVSGAVEYGNGIRVPTVGGEIYFDEGYFLNPLCNVMCAGIVDVNSIARGQATEVDSPVFLVGALTGRDGVHGATFASQELGDDSEAHRSNVPKGDPLAERLIIEACLELIERGCVAGIQDMGAAGITSSSAETAARAGTGIEIDLEKVPLAEEGMTPYEIMLSESQERMLVIGKKGREAEIAETCAKWDVNCSLTGHVRGDGMLCVKKGDIIVAKVPAKALAEGVPIPTVKESRPEYLDDNWSLDVAEVLGMRPRNVRDFSSDLMSCLSSPTIASKERIYKGSGDEGPDNLVVSPGDGDAAVIGVKGTRMAIALTVDGNGRYAYLDPERGGAIAVAEASRNVVCCGAEPVAITNCLNFANPEKGETMWQFARVIEGIARACEVLNTPVTGGNVSFYNENMGKPVYPTPVIGMLGIVHDIDHCISTGFSRNGDSVVLLGPLDGRAQSLGGSEYLNVIGGAIGGRPPELDLGLERQVQLVCLEAAQGGLLHSAHDCSEGGLAVALAECCVLGDPGSRGAKVTLKPESAAGTEGRARSGNEAQGAALPLRSGQSTGQSVDTLPASTACREGEGEWFAEALLFGEAQSRIVVSLHPDNLPDLKRIALQRGVPMTVIGQVSEEGLSIYINDSTAIMECTTEMENAWRERFDEQNFD